MKISGKGITTWTSSCLQIRAPDQPPLVRTEKRLPRQRPARGGANCEPMAPSIQRRVAQRLASAAAARPGAPVYARCSMAAPLRQRCRPAVRQSELALHENLGCLVTQQHSAASRKKGAAPRTADSRQQIVALCIPGASTISAQNAHLAQAKASPARPCLLPSKSTDSNCNTIAVAH